MNTDYSTQQLKERNQRAEEMGLANARAKALTPQEIVEIDTAARHYTMRQAVSKGKPIDFNAASRAGAAAVEAARISRVPGKVTNANAEEQTK